MTAAPMIQRSRTARSVKAAPSPRRLAGFVTIGAMTLSLILAAALPARANDRGDDLAKALIAAVVIGAIIHESRRDDPVVAPDSVRQKKHPYIHQPAARIPAVCAMRFDTGRRAITAYPERCLRREGVRGRLPTGCAEVARIRGKRDRIYTERCLRDAGFEISGKRRRY